MKPTPDELAFAADVVARDIQVALECKARGFAKRGGISYPSDTTFSVPVPTNAERSRAECILFRAEAVKPGESYTAYLAYDPLSVVPNQYRITTFTGETLAHVSHIKRRTVRGSALSNERGSFWARGIDGRLYHGRHNGAGMYCRMRLAKDQGKG